MESFLAIGLVYSIAALPSSAVAYILGRFFWGGRLIAFDIIQVFSPLFVYWAFERFFGTGKTLANVFLEPFIIGFAAGIGLFIRLLAVKKMMSDIKTSSLIVNFLMFVCVIVVFFATPPIPE